jgi:hypothetical protein
MWILYWGGVAADQVKAFICEIEGMGTWPRRELGEAPLAIPPGYEKCIIRSRNLQAAVSQAVNDACDRAGVGGILLAYANHGRPDGVGFGPELIDAPAFALWAVACARAGKRLLVVLSACASTAIAHAAFDIASANAASGLRNAFEEGIGFIASSSGPSSGSRVIVTDQDGLVDLFEESPARDGFVPGFFHRGPMFWRQFNWLLTYRRGMDQNLTVAEFVKLMNPGSVEANGFRAEVVGGDKFGQLSFDFFFGFRALRPEDPAPGWSPLQVKDLIRAEELGKLFDDHGFVDPERETVDEMVLVMESKSAPPRPVSRTELPGWLQAKLAAVDDDDCEGTGPGVCTVPFHLVFDRWTVPRSQMEAGRRRPEVSFEDCTGLAEYLRSELGVRVGDSCWDAVTELADLGRYFTTDDEFRNCLREVVDQIAAEMDEDAPGLAEPLADPAGALK